MHLYKSTSECEIQPLTTRIGEVLSRTRALTHKHHQVALARVEDYTSHLPSRLAKQSSVSTLLLSHSTALCINILCSSLTKNKSAMSCGSLYAVTHSDLLPLHQGQWPPTEEWGRVLTFEISPKWVTGTCEKSPEWHTIPWGGWGVVIGCFHHLCTLSWLYGLFHL